VKKKQIEQARGVGSSRTLFHHVVPSHTYAVGHLLWLISLVVSAATSVRGASRVLALSLAWLQLPLAVPSWGTGRLWLLRLGYDKLTRPKQQADDWVWIVDPPMQRGAEKGLVI